MKRIVFLAAVCCLLPALCSCKAKPADPEGTTAPAETTAVITTENREKTGVKHSADEVVLTDTGLKISLTVPLPGVKLAAVDDGTAFVYTEKTLEEIKSAVESADAEGEIKVYPYAGALRVEYLAVSGDLVTWSVIETTDAQGDPTYLFCDSRAFFSDGTEYYATVKFPYYYQPEPDAFTPLRYARLGDSFRITVSPEDFKAFYAESGIYALKEGVGDEFSLEFPYYDADARGYPLRFTFSNDSEGKRIVTIDSGTVLQEITTRPPQES